MQGDIEIANLKEYWELNSYIGRFPFLTWELSIPPSLLHLWVTK